MADQIKATPRNSLAALLSDAINSGVGYMKSPQRTQQLQGLGRLIESTGIPYTVESLSYDPTGRGLFTGAGGLGGTTRMRPQALEAAMTVAPFGGPVARVAGRGAMATGRAGERLAERFVPQVMERGGLPAELLQGMSRGTVSPLDVYHGSPYKLQPTAANPLGEFDASKIGTGAGAQRYGYGIYTSEAPQFADMFAVRKGLPDLEGIARQNGLELSQDARTELMRQATRDSSGKPARGMKGDNYIDPIAAAKKLQNASIEARQMPVDKLQNTIREFQEQNRAYLYKADLPDEKIAKMLDFDLPIKDQPEILQKIRSLITDEETLRVLDYNASKGIIGGNALLNYVPGKTPALQAETLRKAGIPGVTYKDLDTRNYVSFPGEEKSMRILERNGETAANPFYTDPFGNTIADTTR